MIWPFRRCPIVVAVIGLLRSDPLGWARSGSEWRHGGTRARVDANGYSIDTGEVLTFCSWRERRELRTLVEAVAIAKLHAEIAASADRLVLQAENETRMMIEHADREVEERIKRLIPLLPPAPSCGFTPHAECYQPCTRASGHNGPCAHEVSSEVFYTTVLQPMKPRKRATPRKRTR